MAKDDHYRYFTFPVALLDGAFMDIHNVCQNGILYSVFDYARKLTGTNSQKMTIAAEYYRVEYSVCQYNRGLELFNNLPPGTPKVSLKSSLVWGFNNNGKDEFQISVFLAFAALKSILGAKPYGKTNNSFMLARMAGFSKPGKPLPEQLEKYNNRYQLDKIKSELRINWNLQVYGIHTQGFYFSFKLSLQELVLEAEKKRKSHQLKKLKDEQNIAYTLAIKQLYGK
jgi:hypothetical protein